MSIDLREQIKEIAGLQRATRQPVELNELEHSLGLRATVATPRRVNGPVLALGVMATVLIVIGGVTLLLATTDEPSPATPIAPTPTTTLPETTAAPPSTDVPVTTEPAFAVVPAPTIPVLDLDALPMEVIAEATTASTIGDLAWTVYEGEWTELLNAQLSGTIERYERVDPRVFFTTGLVAQSPWSRADLLASANGADLSIVNAQVDWIETAMLVKGEALRQRSDGGRLLAASGDSTIEIHLFDDPETAVDFRNRGSNGGSNVPIETVAVFELSKTPRDGRWVTEVTEQATGEPVGSISAAFDGSELRNTYTRATTESLEIVTPPWAGIDGSTSYVVTDGTFYVYHVPYVYQGAEPATIWRSTNGTDWTNMGNPAGWPDGYGGDVTIHDGVLVASLSDEDDRHLLIRSEDGVNWSPVADPPNARGSVHAVKNGWVFIANWFLEPEVGLWTSPDGQRWTHVETGDLPMPVDPYLEARLLEESGVEGAAGGRGSMSGATEDAVLITTYGDNVPARLWIIELP